jgi:Flp pilus assembly protein TadG
MSAQRRTLRWVKNRRKLDTKGAVAVEFAILAAMLLMMAISAIDLGMGFYRGLQVRNAAQAGAQYAMVKGFSETSISSAITNSSSFAGISASPAPTKFCGCAATAGVTTATCGTVCADGKSAGTYVTATATATYDTFVSYPMFPKSFNFVSQATVRIQ